MTRSTKTHGADPWTTDQRSPRRRHGEWVWHEQRAAGHLTLRLLAGAIAIGAFVAAVLL